MKNFTIQTRVDFSTLSTAELLLVMCDLDSKADALTRSKSPVKNVLQQLMTDVHNAVFAEFDARKGKAV